MALPRPILSITIAPADSNDRERLHAALARFQRADPALSFSVEAASNITTVRGERVAQLEAVCRRLEDEVHVPLAFASLEVIHLETIRQPAEGEGKYIRQTGGHGNYAHVKLRLQPDEPGKGIDFVDEIKGGVIPPHFIQSIEAGIREAAQGGILAGHELVDFKATAYDGSFHEIDSNDVAFRIAGSLAFKEAAKRAAPILLEPSIKAEFTVPQSRRIALIDALRARRGEVSLVVHNDDGSLKICAIAPLETMLGFDAPVPDETSFIGYREKPRADNGSDEAGSLVTRPRGPGPRTGSAAVDPDADWT